MSIEIILRNHLARYPAMQIQDVYKLLHQAAFGSEHAVPSAERARAWLEREIAAMGAATIDEPVFDPLSPTGKIVRVHLRPFMAQGGDPEILLNAFLCTANEFEGSKVSFEQYWDLALHLKHFDIKDMNDFITPMRSQGYPAAHHSSSYRDEYHPAYRVVLKSLLKG